MALFCNILLQNRGHRRGDFSACATRRYCLAVYLYFSEFYDKIKPHRKVIFLQLPT